LYTVCLIYSFLNNITQNYFSDQMSVMHTNIHTKTRETRLMTTPTTTVAVVVKGKATPLQGWTGPEGSRRLKLPDFRTFSTRRW